MSTFFKLVDPATFTATMGMAIGGVIQTTTGADSNAGNANDLAHVSGWIAFVSFMFLVFNFQWSISAKKMKTLSKARKTYNDMYEQGSNYNGKITAGMLFFAYMSLMAAFLLFGLGVLVLIMADNNQLVNNGNEYNKLPEAKRLDGRTQVYFRVLGWLTIICSLFALLRLPLDYLLASLGIYWLLSIFFWN
jgi:hypothetical protein